MGHRPRKGDWSDLWIERHREAREGSVANSEDVIILLCVRWYLRYSLTYRDLEEIMTERNLSIDHVTIWRWVQRYAPVLNQRIRRYLRRPNRSWRVDETYVKVQGGGHTCIGPSIPPERRSSLCCRRSGTSLRRNCSCGSRYPVPDRTPE